MLLNFVVLGHGVGRSKRLPRRDILYENDCVKINRKKLI